MQSLKFLEVLKQKFKKNFGEYLYRKEKSSYFAPPKWAQYKYLDRIRCHEFAN